MFSFFGKTQIRFCDLRKKWPLKIDFKADEKDSEGKTMKES